MKKGYDFLIFYVLGIVIGLIACLIIKSIVQ